MVAVRMITQNQKEYGRDTRHACAEACLEVTRGNDYLEIVSNAYHNICMNVNVE